MNNLIKVDFKTKKRLPANDEAPPIILGPDQEKLNFFSEAISLGKTSVFVQTNHAGVIIPEWLKEEQEIQLDWSLRFGLTDFCYDESGVSGTLTFNREPFFIQLPWGSIREIRSTVDPNKKKAWGLHPAIVAAYQAAVVQQLLQQGTTRTEPQKENNEPIRENTSKVATHPFRRFAGAVGGLFGRIFGRRV